MYAGSADMMPRNLDHRVEIIFPVSDPKLVRRLKDDILERYLHDERNARMMGSDGTYTRRKAGPESADGQAYFIQNPSGARPG